MMMIFIGGLCSSSLSISGLSYAIASSFWWPGFITTRAQANPACPYIRLKKYTNIIYRSLFANRCYCFVSLHWINSWLMHVPRSVFGRRHNLHCRICKPSTTTNNIVDCRRVISVPCPLAIQMHDPFISFWSCLGLQWDSNNNKYTLARWAERGALFLCTANIFAQSQCWIEWMRDHHQRPRIGGRTALANEMHLVARQGTGMCLF